MTSRSRLVTMCLVAVAAPGLLAATPGPAAPAPAAPRDVASLPERLDAAGKIGAARQVVVVQARNWSTSRARVRTWVKRHGEWQRKHRAMPARIGWTGFHPDRRQGDGSTPAGRYRIRYGFGSEDDPGSDLRYREFTRRAWWVYDPRHPKTYNTWQTGRPENAKWRAEWAEHLWDYVPGGQYHYGAVLDFNLPRKGKPADTRRGGGIFLHVRGDGSTAGCVAVSRRNMVRLLRWFDGDAEPWIVMGPRRYLRKM